MHTFRWPGPAGDWVGEKGRGDQQVSELPSGHAPKSYFGRSVTGESPSSLRILRADPGQAEPLSRISVLAKSHWGYAEDIIASWLPELTITPESITTHPTFTALLNQVTIGFYQLDLPGPRSTLGHLWVLPDYMGRGVGRALLQHAMKHAGETLLIDSDPYAEAFYIACGATRVATIPAAIDGNPDRFLPRMELRLNHQLTGSQ